MAWLEREDLRMKESLARKSSCLQTKKDLERNEGVGHSKDLHLKPLTLINLKQRLMLVSHFIYLCVFFCPSDYFSEYLFV